MFRFALDVAAALSPVAVSSGQVLPGRWVEHKHGTLQAADVIVPALIGRDVSQSEVDEQRLARVVDPTVRKHVAHILEAQIPLRKAAVCVERNDCNPRFPHRFILCMKPRPLRKCQTGRGTQCPIFQLQEVYVHTMR